MAANNSVQSALDRAVGVGGSGTQNLGSYKDANGNTTTYRPEFAGQTVQMGNQYVTYNERGYPTKAVGVSHAQSLGNDYTKKNMGLDQTKISNAADIYKGIYNATMQNGTVLGGSALDNAYGKQNIQYSSDFSAEDYDKLIGNAAAKGSNVLAGFLEDSKNALLQSQGKANQQTSTYNGGWNYTDNGGGVGNIYTGSLKDPVQTDQAFGGGWYAGLGKGDAAEEYFYRNTDAPTMQEILNYAAILGYDVSDETAVIPIGDLKRQMIAGGYVSPDTLQKAETLKITVPAALRNLGIETGNSGTDALDAAIRNMQSRSNGITSYTQVVQQMGLKNGADSAANSATFGGSYGGVNSADTGYGELENQLMDLYSDGGGYTAALQRLRDMTDAQVKQATSGYESQKETVNRSYADMFRQLYIDRENSRKNLGQQMAVYGVTGGAAESTLLGLDTNYQNALRQGEQGRIGEISELDQAILQAELTGDINYAKQALQMEQERLNNYANVLQMLIDRQDAAQQQAYERELEAYKYRQAAQEDAYNKQMTKAELLASAGDFSGYKVLGFSDAEIAALEKAYKAENTSKQSSGSGKTKPTLTLAQAERLLEDGVVTDKTLYAYEYYTGQPWQSGELETNGKLLFSDLIDVLKEGSREDIERYVDGVWDSLTDVQKNEVQKQLNYYGYKY